MVAVDVIQTFDYGALELEQRVFVQQRVSEIRSLLRTRAQNAIEIGQRLIEVKEALGYGNYRSWLESEFEWGKTIANQFEQVAKQFADVRNVDNFDSSALRLLASPSVAEEVRDEAKELAAAGEHVSHARAKDLVSQGKSGGGGASSKQTEAEGFPAGREITVAAGDYQGQTVTVLDSDGVMVSCQTNAGAIVPFLKTELDSTPPKPPAAPKPDAKADLMAGCEAKLQLANVRIEMLSGWVVRALAYVPTELREEGEALLS